MTRYNPQDYCNKILLNIHPYQPGRSIDDLQKEINVSNIIKLASNENLLGPSPKVIKTIKNHAASVMYYPEGTANNLMQALAEHHQLSAECITLGNGSNELLELIARCFLHTGRESMYSEHAFAVYPLVTQLCNATARVIAAYGSTDAMPYGHDLMAFQKQLSDKTAIVFIANPNNPTGTWLSLEEIEVFLQSVPQSTIVVVDQAYTEYSNSHLSVVTWIKKYPNLIVTQTFSKIYALAGLRIGYAISSPEIADLLNRIRQPFNVNLLAQKAAQSALEDRYHKVETIKMNHFGLEQLRKGCTELGLSVLPSATNFLCIEVGDAESMYEYLLQQGIIVRPIANYNLPQHLRVTVGMEEHNTRFLNAIQARLK